MQTLSGSRLGATGQSFVVDLAGGFAAAALDRKATHRGDAIARQAQTLQGFGKAGAEGTDDAGRRDNDATSFYWLIGKSHALGIFAASRFLLISHLKHFTNGSNGNGSLVVVDCQVSLFIGDLKSDKREQ